MRMRAQVIEGSTKTVCLACHDVFRSGNGLSIHEKYAVYYGSHGHERGSLCCSYQNCWSVQSVLE